MRYTSLALLFLLFLLFLTSSTPAQEYRRSIPPPSNADSAWVAIKNCTNRIGVKEYKDGRLRDVKWFETSEWEEGEVIGPTAWEDDVGLGQWIPPDTILLARRTRLPNGSYEGWAVAHELLHHLLRGPPFSHHHSTHPYVPFGAPCEIMAWQHIGEWNRGTIKSLSTWINKSKMWPE